MSTQRFTIRKEYFGGILHDAQEVSCQVLNKTEFGNLDLIRYNGSVEHPTQDCLMILTEPGFGPEFQPTLKRLENQGIIIRDGFSSFSLSPNVRWVELPLIPDHCLSAPVRIYDTFTRRCNLDCPQCCQRSSLFVTEQRRSLDETKRIMRKFWEAGTMEWRFTGGEPTSCPDLPEAMEYAKHTLGMSLMLNTNGCWSSAVRERILASGVDEVIISLEGREEVNDRRRNQGTFRKIISTFDAIDGHNALAGQHIRVTVNMTIGRDNVGEVPFVGRLAAEHGYNFNFVPLRPYGRAPDALPDNMLTTAEYMEFSRQVQLTRELPEILVSGIRLIHRNMDLFCPDYPDRRKFPYPFDYSACGALSTGFGLCPDGRVNACSFLSSDPMFLGPNMLEVTAQDAWLSPEMERCRCAKKVGCSDCRFYMRQCEGKCTAMVLAEGGKIKDGKLLGRDRYCFSHLMPK